MNTKRKNLIQLLELVAGRCLSLKEAALQAQLSYRQIRRLYSRFLEAGEAGLTHGLRGRPSNRSIAGPLRRQIISYYQKHCGEWGPCRAAERLAAQGYTISRETLRRWLIDEGLWRNGKRSPRGRKPKEHFGEMLLLVCGNFSLFNNEPKKRALFAVDDATHTCMCRAVEHTAESAAMQILAAWVKQYGIPMSIACDRHYLSLKNLSREETGRSDELIARRALGRALDKLGIEVLPMSCSVITARVGGVLESFVAGVIKGLGAAGVTSVEEVNTLLQGPAGGSLDRLCARPATGTQDYHVRLEPGDEPDKIFRYECEMVTSKKGLITYNNRIFHIIDRRPGEAAAPASVLLTECLDGRVHIYLGKSELQIREMG